MFQVGVAHISFLPGRSARSTNNNQNRCRRLPPTPTVINCDHYIDLESATQSTVVRALFIMLYSKVVM